MNAYSGDGVAMFNAWSDSKLVHRINTGELGIWLDARLRPLSAAPDVLLEIYSRKGAELTIESAIPDELYELLLATKRDQDATLFSRTLRLLCPYAVVCTIPSMEPHNWRTMGYSMIDPRLGILPLHITSPDIYGIRLPELLHPHITTWATSIPDPQFPGRVKVHAHPDDLAAVTHVLLRFDLIYRRPD